MAKRKENPTTPPPSEPPKAEEKPTEEPVPVEAPEVISIIDPREEARRRSKEDLQKKRRNLRGGRGGF